ncbi:MAG: GNAT family N-acetyltransferase [Flavobacteriales bacterium]|nr:GNAT family N-acetyltransferase [Flavobacteriales bacterium]
MDSNYIFRSATVDEVPAVREMIKKRIDFLREHNIHPSWADRDYLGIFPEEYFIRLTKEGGLIIALRDEKIVACAALHHQDFPRWKDDGVPAFYLHNLCSLPEENKAGVATLHYCMEFSREKGKKVLRLDCIEGNAFLEAFYRKNGFTFLCHTDDNGFKCLLWEMRL